MENRRVVEELQLVAHVLVEDLRGVGALLFHQVPLVRGDDDAAARLLRGAGDGAILIGRPNGGIEHEHDDIGALDGALGEQDAQRFDLRLRDLAGPANAGGVDDAELRPCHCSNESTESRVVPGTSETIIRSSRKSMLTSDDLPAFGRPTIAIAVSSLASNGSSGSSILGSGVGCGHPRG